MSKIHDRPQQNANHSHSGNNPPPLPAERAVTTIVTVGYKDTSIGKLRALPLLGPIVRLVNPLDNARLLHSERHPDGREVQ